MLPFHQIKELRESKLKYSQGILSMLLGQTAEETAAMEMKQDVNFIKNLNKQLQ